MVLQNKVDNILKIQITNLYEIFHLSNKSLQSFYMIKIHLTFFNSMLRFIFCHIWRGLGRVAFFFLSIPSCDEGYVGGQVLNLIVVSKF
jgi:hypothetical protein